MNNSLLQQLEDFWSLPFQAFFEDDQILLKPTKQEQQFPLLFGYQHLSNVTDDFHTFFQQEGQNIIVDLWGELVEYDTEKTPFLFLNIHNQLYCVLQYVTGKEFYEEISLPQNNIIITYQKENLPRVHETLIITRWKDFFNHNNTVYRKRKLRQLYK